MFERRRACGDAFAVDMIDPKIASSGGTDLMTTRYLGAILLVAVCAPAHAQRPRADSKAFESAVKPVIQKHCQGCHNPQLSSGGLDVARLVKMPTAEALRERDRWERISHRIKAGEMPPRGSPRPSAVEIASVTRWIDGTYAAVDKSEGPNPGRVTARRLNRNEYKNTLRDLVGVVPPAADDFPADESGYGFDNIGDVLSVSPLRTEKYLKAAREAARGAIVVPQESVPSTVEHYTAERLKQVGRMELGFDHFFPADGEYTLRATFYQALRDKTKFHGQLLFDGKSVSETLLEFYYAMDRAFEARNLVVRAGRHRIEANIKMEAGYKGALPYIDSLDIRGPIRQLPPDLTASHRKIVICGHGFGQHEETCARRVLQPLLRRAYRRPVTAAEVDRIEAVARLATARGEPLEQGLRLAIEAMLLSPHFLFRIEKDSAGGRTVHRIGDHELASRLSYFLWSSMPDDELLTLADSGKLHTPGILEAQTRRMIADARSRAMVDNFGGQWLQIRNRETAKPDPARFPSFDEELRQAMRTETELFLEAVLREDRSVLDLLDAKFTFLNERLAKHYGVPGIQGPEFRRHEWEGAQRSGTLTQASVLTVSSYPTRTSPVLRGKWVLETLLDTPPPPPPPDAPGLDESAAAASGTMRQQLEKHRSNAVCASCHTRMDPLGFGLENYDAIGQWRTTEGSLPLDTSGVMPDGKAFATPGELKQILRADEPAIARAFTEKLMTYALGRGLERYDRPEVDSIVTQAAASGYRMSGLVWGIVKSAPFQMRRAELGQGGNNR
jgi:mono/diheme cytochrome c family protein